MTENGDKPNFRADIGMRLVVDAKGYTEIGILMDAIGGAVNKALKGEPAAFDFVSFNTHPCKAIQMDDQIRFANMRALDRDEAERDPLPLHG